MVDFKRGGRNQGESGKRRIHTQFTHRKPKYLKNVVFFQWFVVLIGSPPSPPYLLFKIKDLYLVLGYGSFLLMVNLIPV